MKKRRIARLAQTRNEKDVGESEVFDDADDLECFNSIEYFLLSNSMQITHIAMFATMVVASTFVILGQ